MAPRASLTCETAAIATPCACLIAAASWSWAFPASVVVSMAFLLQSKAGRSGLSCAKSTKHALGTSSSCLVNLARVLGRSSAADNEVPVHPDQRFLLLGGESGI